MYAKSALAIATVSLGLLAHGATITPADIWPDGGGEEYNLYDIYNEVYGTNFTSSADLDALQVDTFDFFNAMSGSASFTALATFAFYDQSFGFYETDASGNPILSGGDPVLTEIFNVSEDGFIEEPVTIGSPLPENFGLYDSAGMLTWFSDADLNGGMQEHLLVYQVQGQPNTFVLAWEDLDLEMSDLDYNDLVMSVTLTGGSVIPEPATLTLLGVGVAGLMIGRKRQQK